MAGAPYGAPSHGGDQYVSVQNIQHINMPVHMDVVNVEMKYQEEIHQYRVHEQFLQMAHVEHTAVQELYLSTEAHAAKNKEWHQAVALLEDLRTKEMAAASAVSRTGQEAAEFRASLNDEARWAIRAETEAAAERVKHEAQEAVDAERASQGTVKKRNWLLSLNSAWQR